MGLRIRLLSQTLTRRMSTTKAPDAYLLFPSSKHPNINPEKLWATARPKNKTGEAKLFYNQVQGNPDALTALVSLGEGFEKKPENSKREAVRVAVANGIKQLRDAGAKTVAVDDSVDAHAAGLCIVWRLPRIDCCVQLSQRRSASTNSPPCVRKRRTRTPKSNYSRSTVRPSPSWDGTRGFCMGKARTFHER
jgi:hypothetical protein